MGFECKILRKLGPGTVPGNCFYQKYGLVESKGGNSHLTHKPKPKPDPLIPVWASA